MAAGRHLKRAAKSLIQHPWLSLMGGTSVAVSLTLISLFFLFSLNIQNIIGTWSHDFQVIVYLDQATPETLARQWQTALSSMPETEEVRYLSSAEALQRFRTRLGKDAVLLDGIGKDVLPSSLVLRIKPEFRNREAVNLLVTRISEKQEWRDVQFGAEWIDRLDAFRRFTRLAGTVIGIFLFISSFFIVANTIRLILYTRRDEIKILRLLGATPLYVGLPYIIEGGILGGAGGVISLFLVYLFFNLGLQQSLNQLIQLIGVREVVFLPGLWQVSLVAGGILLGLFASMVALRRLSRV